MFVNSALVTVTWLNKSYHLYKPFARKTWLTVYRAHSSLGAAGWFLEKFPAVLCSYTTVVCQARVCDTANPAVPTASSRPLNKSSDSNSVDMIASDFGKCCFFLSLLARTFCCSILAEHVWAANQPTFLAMIEKKETFCQDIFFVLFLSWRRSWRCSWQRSWRCSWRRSWRCSWRPGAAPDDIFAAPDDRRHDRRHDRRQATQN